MSILSPKEPTNRISTSQLLVFAGTLTVVMMAFHLYLNLATHGVTDIAALLILALAALVVAGFLLAWRTPLRRDPNTFFIFHVISYLIVAGTVSVHAFLVSWISRYYLTGGLGWMVAIWSIGLFVHALATNSARGFR